MPTKHENALTQKALHTLTTWGENPNIDGGENIAFSLARQGAPGDEFLGMGDCTPFTPTGRRGILKGQPVGFTGAPIAYVGSPPGNQIPCTFSFNLNTGKVLLSGSFPNLPANLKFTAGFLKKFTGFGGKNIVFYSEKTSDKAGYVIALQLVAAS
jgi:hypothetical protein